MSVLTITGIITTEGVECPAMRSLDGTLYTLAMDNRLHLAPGTLVRVSGTIATISICMQDCPTIAVSHLEILSHAAAAAGSKALVTTDGEQPELQPVSSVTEVRLALLKRNPPLLAIEVHGFYNSTGWSQPQLLEHCYCIEPRDGIWDMTCAAVPPTGRVDWMPIPFSFTHTMSDVPTGLKGVRIHFASASPIVAMLGDEKTLAALPQEMTDFPDMSAWPGKRFIRKGQPDPGGDVVLEDDLIRYGINYRVLGPNDMGDMRYDPTRVTIHLDANDIINAVSRG